MENQDLVMKPSRDVGIWGWGAYVPRFRIKNAEIARIWRGGVIDNDGSKFPTPILEKAVANLDEDIITMSIEAGKNALKRAGVKPEEIRTVLIGTESKPYAVKSAGVTVATALGIPPNILSATYEFACKAGTEAIQTVMGLVGSGMINYGMAIGADTAQGRPGDELEYTAASGAVAYIIGPFDTKNAVAKIEASYSYATDTPDFWRRDGQKYPRHYYRFTGEPAYFHHIMSAARGLMNTLGLSPEDFTYAVFHQPNYKFPRTVGKRLGFREEQVEPSIVSRLIGNTYAGSSLMGLAAVLDVAKPGDRILMVSFGSGAGSDAFSLIVTEGIERKRDLALKVRDYIENKKYIDYALYARLRGKIPR